MKRFAALLAVLFLTGTLHADVVKIGVILPLTGNSAQLGQPMLRAVELFNKECEQRRYKHKYQLIVEDDQLLPRQTADIMNKLLNLDHVQGLVVYSSISGNVVKPRAAAAKIPHLCMASDPKIGDGKFNFVHWVTPDQQAQMASNIVEKLQGKRVAILCQRNQGWMAIMERLKANLKERGIEVIEPIIYNPDERDFRTQLAILKEKQPDTLIPLGFSPGAEIILRQAKQVGLNCKITSAQTFLLISDPTEAEGLFFASGATATPEFDEHMRTLIGKSAQVYVVPNVYDCLNLIRTAYEHQDKPNPIAATAWIAQNNEPSVLGGTLKMNANGCTNPPADYFQIVKGKSVPVTLDQVK